MFTNRSKYTQQLVVNDVELTFRVNEVASNDLAVPGTGLHLVSYTNVERIYRAAGYRTFDWALPQGFFNDYVNRHGEKPRGVWYYPPSPDPYWLSGRFVPFDEALRRLGEQVRVILNTAETVE